MHTHKLIDSGGSGAVGADGASGEDATSARARPTRIVAKPKSYEETGSNDDTDDDEGTRFFVYAWLGWCRHRVVPVFCVTSHTPHAFINRLH